MHLIKYAHVASELQRIGTLLGRGARRRGRGTEYLERGGCGAPGERRTTDAGMAAQHHYARRLAQWWANGFDILVTPTLATLPFRFREDRVRTRPPARAGFAREGRRRRETAGLGHLHRAVQLVRSARISLPLHWSERGASSRRTAHRRLRPRGPAVPARRAARGGPPVGRAAAADPLTCLKSAVGFDQRWRQPSCRGRTVRLVVQVTLSW